MAQVLPNWLDAFIASELNGVFKWQANRDQNIKKDPGDRYEDDGSNFRSHVTTPTLTPANKLQIIKVVSISDLVKVILSDGSTSIKATLSRSALDVLEADLGGPIDLDTKGDVISLVSATVLSTPYGTSDSFVTLTVSELVYHFTWRKLYGQPEPVEQRDNLHALIKQMTTIRQQQYAPQVESDSGSSEPEESADEVAPADRPSSRRGTLPSRLERSAQRLQHSSPVAPQSQTRDVVVTQAPLVRRRPKSGATLAKEGYEIEGGLNLARPAEPLVGTYERAAGRVDRVQAAAGPVAVGNNNLLRLLQKTKHSNPEYVVSAGSAAIQDGAQPRMQNQPTRQPAPVVVADPVTIQDGALPRKRKQPFASPAAASKRPTVELNRVSAVVAQASSPATAAEVVQKHIPILISSSTPKSSGSRVVYGRRNVPVDQTVLLDKQFSWYPPEPGQRSPYPNVPIELLTQWNAPDAPYSQTANARVDSDHSARMSISDEDLSESSSDDEELRPSQWSASPPDHARPKQILPPDSSIEYSSQSPYKNAQAIARPHHTGSLRQDTVSIPFALPARPTSSPVRQAPSSQASSQHSTPARQAAYTGSIQYRPAGSMLPPNNNVERSPYEYAPHRPEHRDGPSGSAPVSSFDPSVSGTPIYMDPRTERSIQNSRLPYYDSSILTSRPHSRESRSQGSQREFTRNPPHEADNYRPDDDRSVESSRRFPATTPSSRPARHSDTDHDWDRHANRMSQQAPRSWNSYRPSEHDRRDLSERTTHSNRRQSFDYDHASSQNRPPNTSKQTVSSTSQRNIAAPHRSGEQSHEASPQTPAYRSSRDQIKDLQLESQTPFELSAQSPEQRSRRVVSPPRPASLTSAPGAIIKGTQYPVSDEDLEVEVPRALRFPKSSTFTTLADPASRLQTFSKEREALAETRSPPTAVPNELPGLMSRRQLAEHFAQQKPPSAPPEIDPSVLSRQRRTQHLRVAQRCNWLQTNYVLHEEAGPYIGSALAAYNTAYPNDPIVAADMQVAIQQAFPQSVGMHPKTLKAKQVGLSSDRSTARAVHLPNPTISPGSEPRPNVVTTIPAAKVSSGEPPAVLDGTNSSDADQDKPSEQNALLDTLLASLGSSVARSNKSISPGPSLGRPAMEDLADDPIERQSLAAVGGHATSQNVLDDFSSGSNPSLPKDRTTQETSLNPIMDAAAVHRPSCATSSVQAGQEERNEGSGQIRRESHQHRSPVPRLPYTTSGVQTDLAQVNSVSKGRSPFEVYDETAPQNLPYATASTQTEAVLLSEQSDDSVIEIEDDYPFESSIKPKTALDLARELKATSRRPSTLSAEPQYAWSPDYARAFTQSAQRNTDAPVADRTMPKRPAPAFGGTAPEPITKKRRVESHRLDTHADPAERVRTFRSTNNDADALEDGSLMTGPKTWTSMFQSSKPRPLLYSGVAVVPDGGAAKAARLREIEQARLREAREQSDLDSGTAFQTPALRSSTFVKSQQSTVVAPYSGATTNARPRTPKRARSSKESQGSDSNCDEILYDTPEPKALYSGVVVVPDGGAAKAARLRELAKLRERTTSRGAASNTAVGTPAVALAKPRQSGRELPWTGTAKSSRVAPTARAKVSDRRGSGSSESDCFETSQPRATSNIKGAVEANAERRIRRTDVADEEAPVQRRASHTDNWVPAGIPLPSVIKRFKAFKPQDGGVAKAARLRELESTTSHSPGASTPGNSHSSPASTHKAFKRSKSKNGKAYKEFAQAWRAIGPGGAFAEAAGTAIKKNSRERKVAVPVDVLAWDV